MDKLRTKNVGGFPLILDDLRQFFGKLASPSHGIYQAFNNLFRGFGDNFILQGCIVSGTTPNIAITEGWVILGGELIKVDAQTGIDTATDNKFFKVTTFDPRGTKTFQNSTINETYEKNRAIIQGTSGNLAYNGKRLDYNRRGSSIDPEDFGLVTLPAESNRTHRIVDPSSKNADISFMTDASEGTIRKLLIDGSTVRIFIDKAGGTPPLDKNGSPTVPFFLNGAPYISTVLEELVFERSPLGVTNGWVLIGSSRIATIGQGFIPTGIKTDNVFLKTKVINIEEWNMNVAGGGTGTIIKSVTHGLTMAKIRAIDVMISNDDNIDDPATGFIHPINTAISGTLTIEGAISSIGSSSITLLINPGGFFDSADYNNDAGGANRGKVIITYEA